MKLVTVYPALGLSVPCPEPSSPALSTSGGTFEHTKYVDDLLRSGKLRTYNPLEVVTVPEFDYFQKALLCTDLHTETGDYGGQVVSVCGYYAQGDSGGGSFYWDPTSTTTPDNGIIFGTGTGRWVRITDGQQVTVRWFGAKGDNVTNDTAAFTAAVTASLALGGDCIVPVGVYRIDPDIGIRTNVTLRGTSKKGSILKSRFAYSGGATPSGSASSGVLMINQFSFHTVTIENLSLFGDYNWPAMGAGNIVADNHMRHGLYIYTTQDSFNLKVRDIFIAEVSGHGLRVHGTVFQSTFENLDTDGTAGDAFNLDGNNTVTLRRCNGGSMGHTRSQFRIKGGAPFIDSCNGLFTPGIDPAVHRVSWGVFGTDDNTGICQPTIIGCNIEAFTAYGCFFHEASYAEFSACTIQHTAACTTRALHYANVQNTYLPRLDANVRLFVGGGAKNKWGNPETQAVDDVPVYAVGIPYLPGNNDFNQIINVNGTYTIPQMRATYTSLNNYALVTNKGTTDMEFPGIVEITAAMSPYEVLDVDSMVVVDSSAGPVTVTLPPAVFSGFRKVVVCKSSTDGNSVTVDGYSSDTINGSATLVLTTAYASKTFIGVKGQWVAL